MVVRDGRIRDSGQKGVSAANPRQPGRQAGQGGGPDLDPSAGGAEPGRFVQRRHVPGQTSNALLRTVLYLPIIVLPKTYLTFSLSRESAVASLPSVVEPAVA